jgi:Raf kinase inhibitor-like YbhB/YbcL family protein
MPLSLRSPAFAADAVLPARFTCHGDGLLPPLAWSQAPARSAAFALVLEDPDAPGGTFRHFGAYNIPGDQREWPEGPGGVVEPVEPALHDFGGSGLVPPCPPAGGGTHHYRFRLFALAASLSFDRPPTCQGLIAMMHLQNVILDEAVLVATCDG